MVCLVLQYLKVEFRKRTVVQKLLRGIICFQRFDLQDLMMMNGIQRFISLPDLKFPIRLHI